VVERFIPAFSGGDGNLEVVLDFGLPVEIGQSPRAQADIEGGVLSARLA